MLLKSLEYFFWNTLIHDEEVDTKAEEGDLCFYCGGYLFLLERNRNNVNNYNNLIFEKINLNTDNLLSVFNEVSEYLKTEGIEYIRIEGNIRRYNWLKKYFDIVKDTSTTNRNIFYCKL